MRPNMQSHKGKAEQRAQSKMNGFEVSSRMTNRQLFRSPSLASIDSISSF